MIGAKRIWVAQRHDLKRHADRPRRQPSVVRAASSDLDQCLAAPTIELATIAVGLSGTRSRSDRGCQPFQLGVIVEADSREVADRIARSHTDDVKPLLLEGRC